MRYAGGPGHCLNRFLFDLVWLCTNIWFGSGRGPACGQGHTPRGRLLEPVSGRAYRFGQAAHAPHLSVFW